MEIPFVVKNSVPKACLKKKGDLPTIKDDGQLDTISVGADGTILVADSSQPTGVKWVPGNGSSGIANWGDIHGILSNQSDLENALNSREPANANIQGHIASAGNPHGMTKGEIGLGKVSDEAQIPKSVGSAKGSLIGFSGAGAPVEIPVGADAKVLTADATQPSGVAWKDAPSETAAWGSISGSLSNQSDLQTALQSKSDVNHTHISSQVGLGNVTNDKQVKAAMASQDGNLVSWSGTAGDSVVDSGKKASDFAEVSHAHTPSQVSLGNVTNDAQVKKAPASIDGNLVAWSGTTGDTVQDSGKKLSDLASATHNHAGVYEPANTNIQTHINSTANPHNVTADQVVPSQAGETGKFLTTNGATVSWGDPVAGTPPAGNGFRHVTGGAEDPVARLVADTDVAPAAAIAESKLSLNYPTHSNTNDPAAEEKAALAGTSGSPGSGNKYVTDADPRNTNARTPTTHGSTAHTGTIGTPSQVGLGNVTNDQQLTVSQLDTDVTLAANSNSRLPSQKAVKSYADNNFAPVAKGVTGGDTHNHTSGCGAGIAENALSLSDVATANASTSQHGFLPKLDNNSTHFLNGQGQWAMPAASPADWSLVTSKPDKYMGAGLDYTTLADAVTYYTNTPTLKCTLHVTNPITISASTIIPSNISLNVHRGAPIAISNGYSLTINGPIVDCQHQIFSDANVPGVTNGVKLYQTQPFVRPEWWGWIFNSTAIADLTANAKSLQQAINACCNSSGAGAGIVLFSIPNSYLKFGDTILQYGVSLCGPASLVGGGSTINSPALMQYYGFNHVVYRGSGDGGGIYNMSLCNVSSEPLEFTPGMTCTVGYAVYPSTSWIGANVTTSNPLRAYLVTAATSAAGAEPAWTTNLGDTFTSGGVTFKCVEAAVAGIYCDKNSKHHFNIRNNWFSAGYSYSGVGSAGIILRSINQARIEGNHFYNVLSGIECGQPGLDCCNAVADVPGICDSWFRGNEIGGVNPDNKVPGDYTGVRANNTAYSVGNVVLSTSAPDPISGRAYKCIVAGTSASSPPAFNTVPGQVTVDGGVSWRCITLPVAMRTKSGGRTVVTDNMLMGGVFGAHLDANYMLMANNDFADFRLHSIYVYSGTSCSVINNSFRITRNNGNGIQTRSFSNSRIEMNTFIDTYSAIAGGTSNCIIKENHIVSYRGSKPIDTTFDGTSTGVFYDGGFVQNNRCQYFEPSMPSGAYPSVCGWETMYFAPGSAQNVVNMLCRTEGQKLRLILGNTNGTLQRWGQDTIYGTVKNWNGTVWSSEYRDSAAFDYFTNTPSVNDCLYFGTKAGFFGGIKFEVGTAFNPGSGGSVTFVWEYKRSDGSWVTLTGPDPTILTSIGVKTITFLPPTDWLFPVGFSFSDAPQGGPGIRLRIAALTLGSGSEGGANANSKPQFNFIRPKGDSSVTAIQAAADPGYKVVNLTLRRGIWWEE